MEPTTNKESSENEPAIESKRNTKKSLLDKIILGAGVITAIWTVGTISLVCRYWYKFTALEPNEWGDFFAGVFAPLAFLWLVLGFFLQSKELRESKIALLAQATASKEQAKELNQSNKNQMLLIDSTNAKAKLELEKIRKAMQPILSIKHVKSLPLPQSKTRHNFSISNDGAIIHKISINTSDTNYAFKDNKIGVLRNETKENFYFILTPKLNRLNTQIPIEVSYEDDNGESFIETYHINKEGNNLTVIKTS